MIEQIRAGLFSLRDEEYGDFQGKLIPTAASDSVIGVRTPQLRKYARQLSKKEDIRTFLEDLPHRYFDENQLHAFIISEIKDYETCIEELRHFLPYVDNWATCDQMSPKVFKKHKAELLVQIRAWMQDPHPYTVRFGIKTLMQHFLDEDYKPEYPEMVAGIRSEEYYVNMMIAWYFATALAKQYESVLPFLEDRRLDIRTHNKTIQKAVESYRIGPEQKAYLRSLKIKPQK